MLRAQVWQHESTRPSTARWHKAGELKPFIHKQERPLPAPSPSASLPAPLASPAHFAVCGVTGLMVCSSTNAFWLGKDEPSATVHAGASSVAMWDAQATKKSVHLSVFLVYD